MKWTLVFALCLALLLVSPSSALATSSGPYTAKHPWIALWTKRDHNLKEATRVAAWIFRVSPQWMSRCGAGEGGNTARWKLAVTIRSPYALGPGGGGGVGWNNIGSYAFGPWQYMLDAKPPHSSREWGTFGSYVHSAFRAAKSRKYAVPYRFKRPDSFVGQAITTAYMFSIGKSSHWEGSGC